MGWLLPVGTAGGITSGFDGVPDGCGIVKLGNKWGALDPGNYRLWRAAGAAPQAEDLLAWAANKGISDAAARLEELEVAEFVIREGPDIADRIGALTLHLIGECMGNGTEISPVFLVGGRNGNRLQVDANLFEVLLHCDRVSPIRLTCNGLDASRSEPGYRPRIKTLIDGLPPLVRNGVVRLEVATR